MGTDSDTHRMVLGSTGVGISAGVWYGMIFFAPRKRRCNIIGLWVSWYPLFTGMVSGVGSVFVYGQLSWV